MGFFDDIFKDVNAFTSEIQNLKDELVSSVLDPTGELRDTVSEIASELTGKGSSAVSSDDAATDDTTTPVSDVTSSTTE